MRNLCHVINKYNVKQEDKDIVWKLKGINSNGGPSIESHPNHKGSWYNIMSEW